MKRKKRGRPAGAQERNRQAVARLCEEGLSDKLIAKELEISQAYVQNLRIQSGILRKAYRRYTAEEMIGYGKLWFEEYGCSPSITDWHNDLNVSALRRRQNRRRLEAFTMKYGKPPASGTVVYTFGSWPKFLCCAGLPPVPRGPRASLRYKI